MESGLLTENGRNLCPVSDYRLSLPGYDARYCVVKWKPAMLSAMLGWWLFGGHLPSGRPNIVPTHGLRLHQALSESGVNLNCIAERLISSTPPWLFRTPDFHYTLYNVGTKSNTSPDLYLFLYIKVVFETYEGYSNIFTDGSKQGISVAATAVSHDKVLVERLPNHASISSAEAVAILLALDIISQSTKLHFLNLSDSLSVLML
jgi:hypothetical protein